MTRIFEILPYYTLLVAFNCDCEKLVTSNCWSMSIFPQILEGPNGYIYKPSPFMKFLQEKTVHLFGLLFLIGELLNSSGATCSAYYQYPMVRDKKGEFVHILEEGSIEGVPLSRAHEFFLKVFCLSEQDCSLKMFFEILVKCILFSRKLTMETQDSNGEFVAFVKSSIEDYTNKDGELVPVFKTPCSIKNYSESELKSLRIRIILEK